MTENYKTIGTLPQIPLDGFTTLPTALQDFYLVKIINVL